MSNQVPSRPGGRWRSTCPSPIGRRAGPPFPRSDWRRPDRSGGSGVGGPRASGTGVGWRPPPGRFWPCPHPLPAGPGRAFSPSPANGGASSSSRLSRPGPPTRSACSVRPARPPRWWSPSCIPCPSSPASPFPSWRPTSVAPTGWAPRIREPVSATSRGSDPTWSATGSVSSTGRPRPGTDRGSSASSAPREVWPYPSSSTIVPASTGSASSSSWSRPRCGS